jgi:long-chain acyl-CoA synthetase
MVGIEVRVVDAGGSDVPHDNETAGEIWMRGANVSAEYFKMPEETAAVHAGEWLTTGDVAVVDDEGFVTIVDRSKDIIITGGINVYSREVEEALHAHPAVSAAAVIGIPDDRWGEAIHAVVVLAPGAHESEDELLQFAAGRLARYKKPRSLEFVDALPVSATGKVLKRRLREPYWQVAANP